MSDDQPAPTDGTASVAQASKPTLMGEPSQTIAQATEFPEDRSSLVTRARQFLLSPHVRHEDVTAKRRFLQDKGLSEEEIAALLREQSQSAPVPTVPARTYPQPPPSSLPNMLLGVMRVVLWSASAGVALVLFYYRFLLPHLTRSAIARRSLKSHQRDLLLRFTSSLQSFRETQREAFGTLPRLTFDERLPYARCKTLDDVFSVSGGSRDIPEITLLRCGLAEMDQTPGPTSEALFELLYAKLSWLGEDAAYRERLWTMLNECPRFHNSTEAPDDTAHWSYIPPPVPTPTTSELSLSNLRTSTALLLATPILRVQPMLEAFIDLTGFLTAETYTLAGRMIRLPGSQLGQNISTQEAEVRDEIRALKGLVLSRKSFLPPKSIATPA